MALPLFPVLTYVSPFTELYRANDTDFHSSISIRHRINSSRYLYACRVKNAELEKSDSLAGARAIIRAGNLIST